MEHLSIDSDDYSLFTFLELDLLTQLSFYNFFLSATFEFVVVQL